MNILNIKSRTNKSLNKLKKDYLISVNSILKDKNNTSDIYNKILKKKYNQKLLLEKMNIKRRKNYKITNAIRTIQLNINDSRVIKFSDKVNIKWLNPLPKNNYIIIKILNIKQSQLTVYINNAGIPVSTTNYSYKYISDNNKPIETFSYKNISINLLIISNNRANVIEFYSSIAKKETKCQINFINFMRNKYFGDPENLKSCILNRKKKLKINFNNYKKSFIFTNPNSYKENWTKVINNKNYIDIEKINKTNLMIVKKDYNELKKSIKKKKILKKIKKNNNIKEIIIIIKSIKFFKGILNILNNEKINYFVKNKVIYWKLFINAYKNSLITDVYDNRLILDCSQSFRLLKLGRSKALNSILFFFDNIKEKINLKNKLIMSLKPKLFKIKLKKTMRLLNLYTNIYKILFEKIFRDNYNKFKNIKELECYDKLYNKVLYYFIYLKLKNNEKIKKLEKVKIDLTDYITIYFKNI